MQPFLQPASHGHRNLKFNSITSNLGSKKFQILLASLLEHLSAPYTFKQFLAFNCFCINVASIFVKLPYPNEHAAHFRLTSFCLDFLHIADWISTSDIYELLFMVLEKIFLRFFFKFINTNLVAKILKDCTIFESVVVGRCSIWLSVCLSWISLLGDYSNIRIIRQPNNYFRLG